jgi:Bacteriophage head to tail connecting protein
LRSLLRVSGYQDFAAMCPRWDVVGTDTYGSGPGWVALGDAQQLQLQERRKLEAIDKQVKPPMVGPPSLRNEPASLLPGGVTYVADPSGQSFRAAIMPASIRATTIPMNLTGSIRKQESTSRRGIRSAGRTSSSRFGLAHVRDGLGPMPTTLAPTPATEGEAGADDNQRQDR